MEVKTQEIIRYIDLRFIEKDLIELKTAIDHLVQWHNDSPYNTNRDQLKKYDKIIELQSVIIHALEDIHS
jgi:hypothetical protein